MERRVWGRGDTVDSAGAVMKNGSQKYLGLSRQPRRVTGPNFRKMICECVQFVWIYIHAVTHTLLPSFGSFL